MYIAFDDNNNLTYIDWAVPGNDYYCPVCRSKLSIRRGEVRHHYFAHMPGAECSDTWDSGCDMSGWHKEWQERFPLINREVVVRLGSVVHRADILTGKTVIEFQHSSLSTDHFNKRNAFYHGLGYKVVWLFDLTDEIANEKLSYTEENGSIVFNWRNPRNTLNKYDLENGQIELFFQVGTKEKAIVKVKRCSEKGFSEFVSNGWYSDEDFLAYFHCTDGVCPKPIREDISVNENYHVLKRKYNIYLDKQQERAVENVEGATLVLAVPGSGKTTTLISHIGYMVNCKGIDANKILALTYTNAAADDMKKRYSAKFGKNDSVQFRTINSLAYEIVNRFSGKKYTIKNSGELQRILRNIYMEYYPKSYATDGDIKFAQTSITFIKNMMLNKDEASKIIIFEKNGYEVAAKYNRVLQEQNWIDFDDQLVMAYDILKNNHYALSYYQDKYKYFCVDEAQDTSKIQHEIIKLLASATNNIFMVGDEDQSIYRFRAAYPEALLNFKNEYPNPFLLQLETNYRSTSEIVDLASRFIAKNQNRYLKRMNSQRGMGSKPELIFVRTRDEQYQKILDICKEVRHETVFLYRDNACAIPVADILIRNGIPFRIRKPDEIMFFNEHVVRDIKSFLRLAMDDCDRESFKQIYNKCKSYIKGKDIEGICRKSVYENRSVFDAAYEWLDYGNRSEGYKADELKNKIQPMVNMSPSEAIQHIYENGYREYLEEKGLSSDHVEILISLARDDKTIPDFFKHLVLLQEQIKGINNGDARITLSTVHSSKGLEYDDVYIIDVFDGMFPGQTLGSLQHQLEHSQEERRIFYVAMTRARNRLCFIGIADKDTSFIDELFPNERKQFMNKLRLEQEEKRRLEMEKALAEKKRLEEEKALAEKRRIEEALNQQENKVFDSAGNRWIKCEFCGKSAIEIEFPSYGGDGHLNLGTCRECMYNNKTVKKTPIEEIRNDKSKYDNTCPECGGKLVERDGRNGKFIGCSGYPKCRYTRSIRIKDMNGG